MERGAGLTFADSASCRSSGSSRSAYCAIVGDDYAQPEPTRSIFQLLTRRSVAVSVAGLVAFALGCSSAGLPARWKHATLLHARVDNSQVELDSAPLDGRQELLRQVSEKLKWLELHSLSGQTLSGREGHSPSNVEDAYEEAYCKQLANAALDEASALSLNMSFQPSAAQHDLVSHLDHVVGTLQEEYKRRQTAQAAPIKAAFEDVQDVAHQQGPDLEKPVGRLRLLQNGLGAVKAATPARALAATRGKSFAFVMMAHDPEDGSQEFLWGVIPMARALQKLSSHRLIVLTNRTHFQDGTSVKDALWRLNAEVHPVYTVDMPPQIAKAGWTKTWTVAFWKLQIWTLTDYDKLIWLDSDAILYRSIDWMFYLHGVWAQRDDWFCTLNQNKVCSGILLVEPSWVDFHGLVAYAGQVKELPGGDQQLIAEYFSSTGRPVSLLSDTDAAFGQCIGKAPNSYLTEEGMELQGLWDTPAFVHKSGGWQDTNNNAYANMCFSINTQLQLYRVSGNVINVCQFHPLGPYWRDLFCEAISMTGVKLPEVEAYCNDSCWYLGRGGPNLPRDAACGQLNATVDASDYYGHTVGYPVLEVDMKTPVG